MRDQLTKAGLNHVKNFKALDKAREVLKIFEEVVSEDEPTNRKLSSP
jgi:hypothetical protein